MVLVQFPTSPHIVKDDIFFCLIVLQTLISIINPGGSRAFKICWRTVTRIFFIDNFDFVDLNRLTYSVLPALCARVCDKTFLT